MNIKLLNNIGLVVRLVRKSRNVSRYKFHRDTKIHIGRIESGQVNPSILTLARICLYFDVDLADFISSLDSPLQASDLQDLSD